jgi:uncharacterized protein YidB (DUF937 family)
MDDIGRMLGGQGGAGGGDLVGALTGLVGGEGGLKDLVAKLQSGGVGDKVGSWVGTGANEAVEPDELERALGPQKVQALSSQTGLPIGQLLPMLAALLPTIIDALTPDGKVTDGDATSGFDLGGLLEGLAGAAQSGPGGPLGGLGDLLGGMMGGKKG